MSEPVSGSSAVFAIGKAFVLPLLLIAGFIFVWLVVVMTRLPRSPREWGVSLLATLAGSFGGGGFVVAKYGLAGMADTWLGAMGLAGIIFACGLPAWAIVRFVFTEIDMREQQGQGIVQVIKEIKDEVQR